MSETLMKAKLEGVRLCEIVIDGDLMTIEEYDDCLRDGCIIPSDGVGTYVIDNMESDVWASFTVGDHPDWATHVLWFNT
jgi:hypothetical protein